MTENGLLTYADLEALAARLAAPFPEEAVQRAKTRAFKGYDSTGFGYQFLVNRLNETVGIGHWRTLHAVELRMLDKEKGQQEATVTMKIQLGNYIEGEWQILAEVEGYGGHVSKSLGDAKKGAFTNAFKKTVAMLGVGRQAYEGSIDDDFCDPDGHAAELATPPKGAPPRPVTPRPTPPPPAPAETLDQATTQAIDRFVEETNGPPPEPPADEAPAVATSGQVKAIETLLRVYLRKHGDQLETRNTLDGLLAHFQVPRLAALRAADAAAEITRLSGVVNAK